MDACQLEQVASWLAHTRARGGEKRRERERESFCVYVCACVCVCVLLALMCMHLCMRLCACTPAIARLSAMCLRLRAPLLANSHKISCVCADGGIINLSHHSCWSQWCQVAWGSTAPHCRLDSSHMCLCMLIKYAASSTYLSNFAQHSRELAVRNDDGIPDVGFQMQTMHVSACLTA